MSPITIYTKVGCPYCLKAIRFLTQQKGVEASAIEEINVTRQPEKMEEMMQRSDGRMSAPQIFIGETHVGGCDDLLALDAKGDLDGLLSP